MEFSIATPTSFIKGVKLVNYFSGASDLAHVVDVKDAQAGKPPRLLQLAFEVVAHI